MTRALCFNGAMAIEILYLENMIKFSVPVLHAHSAPSHFHLVRLYMCIFHHHSVNQLCLNTNVISFALSLSIFLFFFRSCSCSQCDKWRCLFGPSGRGRERWRMRFRNPDDALFVGDNVVSRMFDILYSILYARMMLHHFECDGSVWASPTFRVNDETDAETFVCTFAWILISWYLTIMSNALCAFHKHIWISGAVW